MKKYKARKDVAKMSNTVYSRNMDRIIESHNRKHNEYMKKIDEENKMLKKIIEDRDLRGIQPDPELLKKIRKQLIEAGILKPEGGLTEVYTKEE